MNIKKSSLNLIMYSLLTLSTTTQAGILDSTLSSIDSISDNVEQNIEQQIQPAVVQIEQPKIIESIQDRQLPNKISPSIQNLPAKLSILNKQGQAEFIEVEVENGLRAIQFEWLITLSTQELQQFNQLKQKYDIQLLEMQTLNALDMTIIRFKVPPELDKNQTLRSLFPNQIIKQLERNYIYQAQTLNASPTPNALISTNVVNPVCTQKIKIGMLDTQIELTHDAFKNAKINQVSFLPDSIKLPKAHATAIASLLVSQDKQLPALLPNATLYSAAVFHNQTDYTQGASLFNLIKGINWLVEKNVTVINMSLAGPNNTLLEKTINKVIAKKIDIVAAAGNEGPTSEPLYPAAYIDVIAVTAVDSNKKIYRWANQGAYIDFAALGVSVKTARLNKSLSSFGSESGTSIATPVISAYTACFKQQTSNYLQRLKQEAEDLGQAGHDPIFGFGLIGFKKQL
ncbi:S8 family serine peptidase [Catenovulum sp. 2E275]|uniref:S8 family serine peptidase n=1 Tax=Catenovulum sp. 2E275 TaxID=2980497 RepID=UPI0021D372E0|nr:S8 family serine peptidase [Catenovulum sp. 2E275]MCU4677077.1 S8 family serine peptidase [Catenovulum sp. 2E275]